MSAPTKNPEPWASIDDVAAHVGVRRDSIYRWIEHRGLPATKVGKLWKLKLSEVDAWMRSREGRRRATPSHARNGDEQSVQFGETFVGMLGEELRTPLQAITSAAGRLGRGTPRSAELARPVGRILTSADRMERMISQLEDFMRLGLGQGIALERATVELDEVVRVALEELPAAQRRRVAVEVVGEARGRWDFDRLVRLVSSLVHNACELGRPGSPVVVAVDASDPRVVWLVVRNKGGIRRADVPHVFDPPRGRPRKRNATSGLGLYLGRQIALAHGGSIRVDTDRTRTTSFRVELPRAGEGGLADG
jgi:excisionase family DNA binding protein